MFGRIVTYDPRDMEKAESVARKLGGTLGYLDKDGRFVETYRAAGDRAASDRAARETIPVVYESKAAEVGGFTTAKRDREELAKGQALGVIHSAKDVYDLLHVQLSKESQEVFLVLPIDIHGQLLSRPVEVARGQRDRVNVDPGDVIRPVLTTNAAGFILVHNHPTTHANPSPADRKLTNDVRAAAKIAAPTSSLIDHVVIGSTGKQGEYYSITENKLYRVRRDR